MIRLSAVLLVSVVALCLAGTASARDTVFIHINLVPMDREVLLYDQTLIVRDSQIIAVGPALEFDKHALIIDGQNELWLSPGLADMHVHSDTREDMAAYLVNGVTTVANMGGARAEFVGRTAPAGSRGDIPGPQVFNAFIVDGSPEYGHFTVATPEQGRAAVGLAKSNGYRMIKVYNNLEPQVFFAVADEAHQQGLAVVGHSLDKVGLRSQVGHGQVLVAHLEELFYSFFSPPGSKQTDTPPSDTRIAEAAKFLRDSGTAIGADLVTYGSIMRAIGHPETIEACLAAPAAGLVSPADRLGWRRSPYLTKTAKLREKYEFLQRMTKVFADEGIELLAGSDAPTVPCVGPGKSLHDDLSELERAGLTRFQALSTATRLPGQFSARELHAPLFGIAIPGTRADLILTSANPLIDLDTLRKPVGVMAGGKWYDAEQLRAVSATVMRANDHSRP